MIGRSEGIRVLKIFRTCLAILGFIMIGPIAFATYFSFKTGCFLCMEGSLAGSAQEKNMNVIFLSLIILVIFIILYFKYRKND